ncbi:MAG TPA: lytic polysaccharide monooxygenase [Solirubrobacteraceae bacterium]|nr:lytic polysaccharide monooxygenase [Solirubrobacteraceae bacterium]
MLATLSRSLLAAAALLVLGAAEAQAHGTTLTPASRNYVCRYLDRASAPCAFAWEKNPQALYDWMGVLISRADDRHRQLIPDGELCSAGDPKFAALDRPTPAWLATELKPGRQTFTWVLNAPHATKSYRFYLTKQGYDVAQPLGWSDLELIHDSGPRAAAKLDKFSVDVPARTGRHVLYAIWQRSDSPEAFYACSDVVFGAAGQVPLNPPMPDESANQPGGGAGHEDHAGHAQTTGSAKPSSKGIRLTRKIDNRWNGGYCATVTVRNRGKVTRAWKGTLRIKRKPDSIWNAKSHFTRGRLHVQGEAYNATLKPGAKTTFGFCTST